MSGCVLHRIDDLENMNMQRCAAVKVLHRIDDLEMKSLVMRLMCFVLHRIDDLEKPKPLRHLI